MKKEWRGGVGGGGRGGARRKGWWGKWRQGEEGGKAEGEGYRVDGGGGWWMKLNSLHYLHVKVFGLLSFSQDADLQG